MNKNKYLFALIGLLAGFLASYYATKSMNESAAGAAPKTAAGAPASGQSQQAMMGDVRAIIEKAKNNPQDYEAQINAADAFYQIQRFKDAAEYLEKAYQINPAEFIKMTGAVAFLGKYSLEEKKFDEAEKWFQRAIESAPTEIELHIELATVFLEREPPAPDKAIEPLNQALKVQPKNGHALGHLVEAYLLKKDARAAEATLSRLQDAEPNNKRIAVYQNLLADLKAGKPITIPKE
ncbi:MAG: tetratricopeptide repeat protein [Acidobacteriota bacterium]